MWFKKNKFKTASIAAVLFIVWFIPWVFVFKIGILAYFPYTPDGTRYLRITGPLTSSWTKPEEIPDICVQSLFSLEDPGFFRHDGVIWNRVKYAYKKNKEAGKIVMGGSTLTQQLVKNAFLSREKSYLRKSREIAGALIADKLVDKIAQLDWYLNIVEFGPHQYGLSEAAHYYFNKKSTDLSPSECVALATLLPNPLKLGTGLKQKNLSDEFKKRYNLIVRGLVYLKFLSIKDFEDMVRGPSGMATDVMFSFEEVSLQRQNK